MTIYVGIDIGLSGGIAILDDKDEVIMLSVMPVIDNFYDISSLKATFKTVRDLDTRIIVGIETPIAMPGHGAPATLKTGVGYGLLLGYVTMLNCTYMTVAPNKWTKTIHAGLPKEMKAKDKSRIAVQKLYPNEDLRATPRCKKIHEGLMDALLIATYIKGLR